MSTDQQPFDQAVLEKAAGMLRAAGEAERLKILALLLQGEHRVSEIAASTGAEMSTTSQRLRTLLQEALLKRRREGRDIFYRLADSHVETLVRNVIDHAGDH